MDRGALPGQIRVLCGKRRTPVPRLDVGHKSLSINSFAKRSARNDHCASATSGYNKGIAVIVDGFNLEPSAGSTEAADGRPEPRLIKLKSANLRLIPSLRPQGQKCDAAEYGRKSENRGRQPIEPIYQCGCECCHHSVSHVVAPKSGWSCPGAPVPSPDFPARCSVLKRIAGHVPGISLRDRLYGKLNGRNLSTICAASLRLCDRL